MSVSNKIIMLKHTISLLTKKFLSSKDNLSKTELPSPSVFEVEPTNICNLRCVMCHVCLEEQNRKVIFDAVLLDKIDSIKGKWVCIGSNFEPLMHPQFADIVKKLSDMGCKIDITTNGTLLTQKLSNQISSCNIKNVTISFDSVNKDLYENIRRGARFENAIENILYFRNLLKQSDAFFAVNMVLMKSNIDELVKAVDFWNSTGFHQLRFIFMVLRSLERKDLLQEILYPIRKYAFQQLDDVAKHVITNNLKITLSSPYYNWSGIKDLYRDNIVENIVKSNNPNSREYFNPRHYYQKGVHPPMKVNCRSPFSFARLMWNGDVQLCYKFVIGNIKEMKFEEIWHGKEAYNVRRNIVTNENICHACDYFRLCLNSNSININERINYFQQHLIEEAEKFITEEC